MKRVVITGAGTVNALALDVPGTLQAFREGRCGITTASRSSFTTDSPSSR
jgi:3-oxoacyl-(acyl-carrier-protein) synthase